MKRILCGVLALVLSLALAGCGGDVDYTPAERRRGTTTTEETVTTTTASQYTYTPPTRPSKSETTPPPTTVKEKTILYTDEKVVIRFDQCRTSKNSLSDYEIVFEVENKIDATLTFQVESIALDGISIPSASIIMSDEVAPRSKGRIYLRIYDESIPLDPDLISGELRIIDFAATSNRSYNAKFININL